MHSRSAFVVPIAAAFGVPPSRPLQEDLLACIFAPSAGDLRPRGKGNRGRMAAADMANSTFRFSVIVLQQPHRSAAAVSKSRRYSGQRRIKESPTRNDQGGGTQCVLSRSSWVCCSSPS